MARDLVTASGRRLKVGSSVLGASLRIHFRVKALAAVPAGSPVTWFQPFARDFTVYLGDSRFKSGYRRRL